MPLSIGKGSLLLSADTAQLDKGLSNAAGKINQFQGQAAGSLGKGFGFAGAVAGITIAVAAVQHAISSLTSSLSAVLETSKEVSRLAAAFGTSAETASELAYAAKVSGADLGALEHGLKGVNEAISKAAPKIPATLDTSGIKDSLDKVSGTGFNVDTGPATTSLGKLTSKAKGAAGALRDLGLDAGQLSKLDAAEKLGAIADALNGVQDPAERVRLSVELFGKGAVALGPLLAKGSEGLKKAGEEAKRLGVNLNEADQAKLTGLNESLAKLGQAGQGAFNKLLTAAAPGLTKIAELITDLLVAAQPVFDGIGKFITENVADWGAIFSNFGGLVMALFAPLRGIWDSVFGGSDKGEQALGRMVDSLQQIYNTVVNGLVSAWNTVASAVETVMAPINQITLGIAKWVGDATGLSGLIEDVRGGVSGIAGDTDHWQLGIKGALQWFTRLIDTLDVIGGAILKNLIVPIIRFTERIVNAHAIAFRLAAALPGGGEFKEAADSLDRFKEKLHNVADAEAALGQKFIDSGKNNETTRSLEKFFKDAEDKMKAEAEANKIKVKIAPELDPHLVGEVAELTDKLKEQIATVGMTADEANIWKLSQEGATDAMLANVRALAEQKRLADEAHKIFDSSPITKYNKSMDDLNVMLDKQLISFDEFGRQVAKTHEELLKSVGLDTSPLEQYQHKLDDLKNALDKGVLTWDDYSLGVAKAAEQLENAAGLSGEIKTPSAMVQGSKEAVSTIIKAQLAGQNNDPANRLQRAIDMQTEIQRKQLQAAQDLAKAVQAGQVMLI